MDTMWLLSQWIKLNFVNIYRGRGGKELCAFECCQDKRYVISMPVVEITQTVRWLVGLKFKVHIFHKLVGYFTYNERVFVGIILHCTKYNALQQETQSPK